jgi:hypothetical protein
MAAAAAKTEAAAAAARGNPWIGEKIERTEAARIFIGESQGGDGLDSLGFNFFLSGVWASINKKTEMFTYFGNVYPIL